MDRWEKFEMRVSVQEVFLDIATKRRERKFIPSFYSKKLSLKLTTLNTISKTNHEITLLFNLVN